MIRSPLHSTKIPVCKTPSLSGKVSTEEPVYTKMWIIQSIVNLGRQVLPYFWFSLGSAALILLTLKGVELLYRMLLDKSDYTVIAPFTLTGGTDTTNTAGIALA